MRGGVRILFGCESQVGLYWVLVDVGAAGFEVLGVADEVVGEAFLPDRALEVQPVGEGAFDQVHDFRDRLVVWR